MDGCPQTTLLLGQKAFFQWAKLFVSGEGRFLWFPLFVGSWTLDVSCCCFMPTIRNGSQTWLWWRCFNNLTAKLSQKKRSQDANPHKSDSSIKEIIIINNLYRHRHIITARFSKQFQNSTHIEVIFGLCRPQCFFSRSGCRLRASSQLWVVRAFQKHHSHINSRTQLPFWNKMIDNQCLMMFNVWWFRISHSISRFEAPESGKNNCRSSDTAPSEFAFRSLGGASNVPGKQGTVKAENPEGIGFPAPSAFQVAGARCAFSNLRQFAVGSNDVAMLWISIWMVLYLFHLGSKLAQMSLQPDKPWPRLHALFLSGLTRFTLWYNTQDAVHVASKFNWRCYQAEMSRFHIAPRACMSHAIIDQDGTSCYKQKDWMQKMFAFINLKTFLPDCMKNRRTDTPVTECRWSGRRHCQGQGWYPKWFN